MEYTWVLRAPGERYVRSWILHRRSTGIRIRAGRAGREKEIERYRVRSKKRAADRCAELLAQRQADGWILAASEATEVDGFSRIYSSVPVRGAPMSLPEEQRTYTDLRIPRKKRVVDLVTAVRAGDAEAARGYLEAGADPDQRLEGSISMLTLAAYFGHLEVLDLLLEAGASRNPPGLPPLETAAGRGHGEAVRRLIEAGAGARARDSALHTALEVWQPKIVELLIERGADVNALDRNKGAYRPLDYALTRGNHSMTRRLLERGARIGGALEAAAPPVETHRIDDLFEAIDADDVERARQLIDAGVSVQSRSLFDPKPLNEAARRGHPDMVRLLLEAGADPAGGSVLEAAHGGHFEVTKVLLEAGGSADSCDEDGTTALIYAALSGSSDLVRLLVEHGADVDHQDSGDSHALTEAAFRGHGEIYDFLRPLTRDPEIRAEAEKLIRRRRRRRRAIS